MAGYAEGLALALRVHYSAAISHYMLQCLAGESNAGTDKWRNLIFNEVKLWGKIMARQKGVTNRALSGV